MKNLGYIESADTYIRKELEKANINIIQGEQKEEGSVSYSLTGELNGWELTRKWVYWEAVAKDSSGLPVQIATELHNKEYPQDAEVDEMFGSFEDDIRTYGAIIRPVEYDTQRMNATRSNSDEGWFFLEKSIWDKKLIELGKETLSYPEILEMYSDYYRINKPASWSQGVGAFVLDSVKNPPEFIDAYKISTQEGLDEFARVIKSL